MHLDAKAAADEHGVLHGGGASVNLSYLVASVSWVC